MLLHTYEPEFKDLITIVAEQKNLPESAVERDYYMVLLLMNLAKSEYASKCVFKGGTSLSKCYPGSIERFSEDIDLTYLGDKNLSDKQYSRNLKRIEAIMSTGAHTEKINAERNDRNKSMYVWFTDKANRVKLEIGSSVRPDPYSPRPLKSYIQEFLEKQNAIEDIQRFKLETITINVLGIERTFIDKIMSVKRHAICGTINSKARHIYDVTKLFSLPEIKTFLEDKSELKRLVKLTKETDSFYLNKRNIAQEYNPLAPYDFNKWEHFLDSNVKSVYERLHQDLLYTNEPQNFAIALDTFRQISDILKSIDE